MNNNIAGTLTICKKAGKLEMGMDMLKASCKNKTAKLVLTAKDLSEKSLKEVGFICKSNKVDLFSADMTMNEIAFILRKPVGILTVCDDGFAKSIAKKLSSDSQL